MRTFLLCSLVAMLLFALHPTFAADTASREQQRAIARATKFLQDVHWTTNSTAVVTPVNHYRFSSAWKVEFGRTSVTVDHTGKKVLVAYHADDRTRVPREATGNISPDTALQAATKYLKAAGAPVNEARVSTNHGSDSAWTLSYNRVYRGYVFADDLIRVTLDSRDATLRSLSIFITTPVPASTKINITKAKAITAARQFLERHNVPPGKVLSVELRIVRPNHYLQAKGQKETPAISRLAWMVRFSRKKEPDHYAEAWVDAENGNIVGGMQCR